MNSNEFNDLEKFGKVIEKPPEKDTIKLKKRVRRNPSISLRKVSANISNKLLCFIRDILVKINNILARITKILKEKKEIRKRYKIVVKRHRKRKDLSYKIVETKKQRGNKTIIVRRRVPAYFDTSSLVPKTSNMASVYYLSLDEESEKQTTQVKHDSYTTLKKSVWDFPLDDKSIFRRTINTLKIQRLFKR